MTINLEPSLNFLKLALAHASLGSAGRSGQPGSVASVAWAASGATPVLGLSESATRQLDLQRQLDSAYSTQAMFEVIRKTNALIMTRLRNLNPRSVQLTTERNLQSERAALASQFEGMRNNLLGAGQNMGWKGTRLLDGMALGLRAGSSESYLPDVVALRRQMAGNLPQAVQAQANAAPQAVISVLQSR